MADKTNMHIKINTTGLDAKMLRASHELPEMNRQIVKRVTLEAMNQLKKESPVGKSRPGDQYQSYRKGGQLRSSVGFELSADGMSGKAGPSAKHAIHVVKGTPPHVIRPKIKKALYWVGARHPVRRVHHPGTSKDDFVTRAKENTEDKKKGIAEQEKRAAMGRIGR